MANAGQVSFVALAGGDKALTSAPINFTASGDNTVIAAGGTGRVNRVYRLFLVVGAATSITFKHGATALSGPIPLPANGAITLDFEAEPWFECADNEAFVINSSAGVQVSGTIYFTQG
jgi:hypothetical protein